MNEGLAILDTLVSQQWACFWPQPLHARIEILTGLSLRLHQLLRSFTLNFTDSTQAYQASQYLNALADDLRQQGVQRTNPLNELRTFMHNNTAARLESPLVSASDHSKVLPFEAARVTPRTSAAQQPWVYVVEAELQERETGVAPHRPWKVFSAGVLTALLVGGLAVWGWQALNRQSAALVLVAPVPMTLSEPALSLLKATQGEVLKRQAPRLIAETTQQLEQLTALSPVWAQDYGFVLVHQANRLWPESPEAQRLNEHWQQQLTTNATPLAALSGWHQTMEQLQQLTRRLDGLDEKRGHYMTVSELKSVVFAMTQSMERSVPLEERLYQLTAPEDKPLPMQALQHQVEINFTQLLNRYALIKRAANRQ